MNNKIKVLALGSALVMLSAASMHAFAQDNAHEKLDHRVQFPHPMMDSDAPWISIALRHKTELNLSSDQVANLEKIRTAFQNQITPIAQQLKAVEGELRAILQESPANLVLARTKIDQGEKLRADLRYLRVEALENGKTILSAQQRDQLKNLFMSRHQGMVKPNKGQPS